MITANTTLFSIGVIGIVLSLFAAGLILWLLILAIRALRAYLRAGAVRTEKAAIKKSLGEVIQTQRTARHMTQEFVAESLGVSRQAVSKWERGASDPSTSNLFALAQLFGISVEELLQEVQGEDEEQ